MIKLLLACWGAAILVVGTTPHGRDDHSNREQDCRDGITAGSDATAASSTKVHNVRLSWDASVSAKNSFNAIKGYDIYRREPGREYEKINQGPIPGTHCVDYSVKAGQTYQYEAVAISAQGTPSKPSNIASATIPSP
jgi:fibronectin type 3 domain-containing protein